MSFKDKILHSYRVVSALDGESDAHHESGVSATKTIDSLMYHLMREDKVKKLSVLKTIEDYVEEQGIDNEYMVAFSKKLLGLSKALLNKYSAEEEPEEEESKD
jgi:hypothetical protein